MLAAHDTLLTQMYDELNWLRQLSCFIVSSPLEHFQYHLCTATGISGLSGSHILCTVSKVFANLVECMISLPEKLEIFQSLLLDLHLVCS
jgi:hypothetical protein